MQTTDEKGMFYFIDRPKPEEFAVLQVYWVMKKEPDLWVETDKERPEYLLYQQFVRPQSELYQVWLGKEPAPILTYLRIYMPYFEFSDQMAIFSDGGPVNWIGWRPPRWNETYGVTYLLAPTEIGVGPLTIQYFSCRDNAGQLNDAGETITCRCTEPGAPWEPDATWEVIVEEGSNQIEIGRPASKCAQ